MTLDIADVLYKKKLTQSEIHYKDALLNTTQKKLVAQLVEHCSANAGTTGSNPVEALKNLFFRATSQLLKL